MTRALFISLALYRMMQRKGISTEGYEVDERVIIHEPEPTSDSPPKLYINDTWRGNGKRLARKPK